MRTPFHSTKYPVAKSGGLITSLVLALSCSAFAGGAPTDWTPAQGTVFAARDAHFASPVAVWKEDGRKDSMLEMRERGRAIYGRDFEWLCDGGSFVASQGNSWLGAQVDKAGAFSLELTMAPMDGIKGPRAVAWSFGDDAADAVSLEQDGARWSLRYGKSKEPLALFSRGTDAPFHLLVSVGDGTWRAYVDGKLAGEGKLEGSAAGWGAGRLVLGASASGANPWRGRVEGLAVYPRILGADEAAAQAAAMQARRAKRQPAKVVRFRGTLLRQAESSHLKDIVPYVRSLTMAEYKVDQVLEGEWTQPTILVLHWALMDSVRLPLADRKPGTKVELSVEPLAEHPELEPNRRDELPDANLDADVFYCESEKTS